MFPLMMICSKMMDENVKVLVNKHFSFYSLHVDICIWELFRSELSPKLACVVPGLVPGTY